MKFQHRLVDIDTLRSEFPDARLVSGSERARLLAFWTDVGVAAERPEHRPVMSLARAREGSMKVHTLFARHDSHKVARKIVSLQQTVTEDRFKLPGWRWPSRHGTGRTFLGLGLKCDNSRCPCARCWTT